MRPDNKLARIDSARARRCAQILHPLVRQVLAAGKPADRILSAYLRQHKEFGSQDRRFFSETFFSFFRWWGWLQGLPGGGKLLELEERRDSSLGDHPDWLRMLLAAHMLDSGPELHPSAAAWKLPLELPGYLAGLATLPLPERAETFAQQWGIRRPELSQLAPNWLFQEMQLGREDSAQILEDLQRRPPIWLRAQTADLTALLAELRETGLDPQPARRLPGAYKLDAPRVNLYELPAYREGRIEVQDLSSQCIGWACQPQVGQRWWDVCAGAGGKSLQLACLLQQRGVVVATDIREWKLADLRKRARRAGLSNISPREWSGEGLPSRSANFQGVLVDAPCSCSGTWRRNPDARWTTTRQDLEEMSRLQRRILETACRGVKSGGSLVYATCSLVARENEDVVIGFLADHPEFRLDPLAHPLTGAATSGMFRVLPADGDCDASFVARMRRVT